jgi:3-oxoacyl-[acyl-carrier protein] reductase
LTARRAFRGYDRISSGRIARATTRGLLVRKKTHRERNMGQLNGRVAIVTGSGRGIGRAIALRLAQDGASVVVNDIDEEPARQTIALIEQMGGRAVACNGDVAAKDFGPRIVKTAIDAFGDCHILVNNAGYTWDSVIQKMTDEQWETILDLHLTAPFRIMRAFFDHLKKATDEERKAGERIVRKVVNISSVSGTNGNAGQANYSAAKAGIVGLTKTIAKEWGRYAVTVNAVAFGYIQTRLTKPLQDGEDGTIDVDGRQIKVGVQGGRLAALNQMIPLGRGGTPEEAAGSVYLFCSPDSDYVSGQCLVVNGGV